jgi:hypothetical protein
MAEFLIAVVHPLLASSHRLRNPQPRIESYIDVTFSRVPRFCRSSELPYRERSDAELAKEFSKTAELLGHSAGKPLGRFERA